MAEQCGERDVMITIKRFIRQRSKPIGKQYYLVLDNFKHDGNNVWIYEEDLLAMLKRLIRAMDEPIMEDVDYSDMYEVSEQLGKKCKKKKKKKENTGHPLDGVIEKGNNLKNGLIDYVKGGKSTPSQIETEEEADKSPEELLQESARIEEERIQKEKEKEQKRRNARDDWFRAKQELEEEKAKFNRERQIEQIFNKQIQPLVEPFLKVMESLIYFAGCLDAEDFSSRKRILRNRQQMLCSIIQTSLGETPLEDEVFRGIDKMLAAMHQEMKVSELPQIPDPYPTIEEYLQEKQKTEKSKQKYLSENEKLRLNDFRQKQILEYICLFRELYPVVVKICAESQTDIEEQWAISIGREIVRIVDQHQSRNESMKFIFVYPDNEAHTQNESVKIDFIAAEADCPGLYYRDSSGELICVIPGRVK